MEHKSEHFKIFLFSGCGSWSDFNSLLSPKYWPICNTLSQSKMSKTFEVFHYNRYDTIEKEAYIYKYFHVPCVLCLNTARVDYQSFD